MAFSRFLRPALCIIGTWTILVQARSGCNPLTTTTTCLSDPALGLTAAFTFNTDSSKIWSTVGAVNFTDAGASFAVSPRYATGWLQSEFYIYHGRYEAWIQGANESDVSMSMYMLSDISNEIALKIDSTNVTTARLSSLSQSHNETYKSVDLGVNTSETSHNYTIVWTEDSISWYFDSSLLSSIDSTTLGSEYPKAPMLIGISAGYSSATDDSSTTAFGYLQNATIEDFSSGANYTYVNITSQSFDIEITAGTSDVSQAIIDSGNEVLANGSTTASTTADTSSSSSSANSAASAVGVTWTSIFAVIIIAYGSSLL